MAGQALVLGGGGVTGVAWELGVIAGLAAAGIDLASADLMIGTSAGSVVAAQLATGTPIEQLYQAQLEGYADELPARMTGAAVATMAWASLTNRDETRMRARIGTMARATKTIPAQRRIDAIASRLPVHAWPDRNVLITAVAADNGEFVVFDRASGVGLVEAVAASCAVPGVWPTVPINGREYMDGGMRSPANVDLVAQQTERYERVVVLAPTTAALRRSARATVQAAALPAGTRSVVIGPDASARRAIGRNVLDPSARGPAARAGRQQATTILAQVAAIWS